MSAPFFKVQISKSVTCAVLAGFMLSGCGVVDVDSWFSGGTKSKLKGERVSVMTAADDTLKADDSLNEAKVSLPAPYVNEAWPAPGGYPSNAMYHLQASGPLKQIWQADAGKGSDRDSRLTAPPIVAGSRVYVLDAATKVYAFDARSGNEIWTAALAPKGEGRTFLNSATLGMFGENRNIDPTKGFGGGVAFDDGKVFVTTGFGSIVALNAQNGSEIWRTDLGVPIVNAPVANGGRVFISTQENHFFALAQADGRKLWDHQGITEAAGILSSTSAAVAGEFVIAPYSSGELYAIRVQNGRAAWNDMLTRSGNVTALSGLDDIAGRPVVDRDMVFAISHSGVMAALRLSTGDRVWSRDVGGIQTPWVAGDYVYVLTGDAQLICMQRKDGRVKWISQLLRWENAEKKSDPIVWSGPVLVSDRLVVVSSTGIIASISPYTGKMMGRESFDAGTMIAPVVANETLYILNRDAELLALK